MSLNFPTAKGRKRDTDSLLQAFRLEDWLRPPAVAEQLDVQPPWLELRFFVLLGNGVVICHRGFLSPKGTYDRTR